MVPPSALPASPLASVPPAPFRFELPDGLAAHEPPEKRGLTRDGVRLLSVNRDGGTPTHTRFHLIADLLRPGDCLVFNASRTLPAVLPAYIEAVKRLDPHDQAVGTGPIARGDPTRKNGIAKDRRPSDAPRLQLRLARRWQDESWSVLALTGNEEPWRQDLSGASLVLAEAAGGGTAIGAGLGLSARVLGRDPNINRLWKIRFSLQGQDLMEALSRLGDPVRYWYASAPWDLDYYQTVYAREPGSVEMPSAGRPFTWKLLLELRRRGIATAFLILHAGLSSYLDEEFDAGHPASVEPFRLDAPAAESINAAKARGGRVIAVGTTVVRALESIADARGRVHAEAGNTRLRITPGYALKTVDGLLTGFHEPSASHLDLLTAFLPPDRLAQVYQTALREKYLWHEFGDMNLIL